MVIRGHVAESDQRSPSGMIRIMCGVKRSTAWPPRLGPEEFMPHVADPGTLAAI